MNAAALERSLYLLSEILILDVPVVIGLNMMDVAERHKTAIDIEKLEKALGVPVVPLVATKNLGPGQLLRKAAEQLSGKVPFCPVKPVIKKSHRDVLEKVLAVAERKVPEPYNSKWFSVKLLEGDREVLKLAEEWLGSSWEIVNDILMDHEDAYLDIVGERYEWISKVIRAAVKRPKAQEITRTDRIDRFATHPIAGIFILLSMLMLVFLLTYAIALPVSGLLEKGMDGAQSLARGSLTFLPPFFSGLLVEGFLGGAGMVIAFLPTLIIFFVFLALMEDVGYLSRVAYVMDAFMHRLGLHGKSFIPFFLGFGCNVPAILGSRIVDEKRGRTLTILLAPFVPCTARIAVITFLAPAFFGKRAAFAMAALVILNIAALFVVGIAAGRLFFREERGAFIMELPLYQKPSLKIVSLHVYNNVKSFLMNAATIIVLGSGVIWFLSAYPSGSIENSYLASFGRVLEPVGAMIGVHDWKLMVALLTSIVSKENTIAALGVLFGSSPEQGLAQRVSEVLTIPSAFAFLVVQMLFIPCLASLASIKQEAGWKWTFVSIGLLLLVSLACGIAAYHVLRLFCA